MTMKWPGLVAITLDARGGGVAAASRLMWQAFQDRWHGECRLETLVDDGAENSTLETDTATRVAFGARLAKAQVLNECRWLFYSHLGVAQVQNYLPSAFRRPYGIFLHGIEVWRELTAGQRRLLSEASLLVANSEYTARRVRETHPWMPPVEVCPLALPQTSMSDAVASGEPAATDGSLVLVVGRMAADERYKGHDQLIEAWGAVLQSLPRAQLVFAGSGDDQGRLESKARGLGLGGSIRFTGFLSDPALEALYRESAVFAMPSRNEGFGLVYLEAMAHGLPCIGSVHDAAGDVIEDGVTGFLVDQADSVALAERIVRLLSNEDLRATMGARGRQRLMDRFSYTQFRDRFTSLIAEAFEGVASVR
jgi:phosphatidylinositol alpha-1,6-mannosyltransferase